jgi:hypothetical protein
VPALDRIASQYALAVALSLRAIGLTSLAAFLSLLTQVLGLFGEHGILPMVERVDRVEQLVAHPMSQAPSVFFVIGGSDAALVSTCLVGALASCAMIASVGGGLAPLVAYLAYLSFVSLGAPFLPLQWDTLLTESLAVAFLCSPRTMRHVPLERPHVPEPAALFALWFLITRLMFASGYVKLASGDEAWRSLRALDYHFETQPLPTLAGYALHFGPSIVRSCGVLMTFVVELGLPFAVLFGARGRRVAARGFALLLVVIAVTGNYGFFDWLALALTVALVDDETIEHVIAKVRGGFRVTVERLAVHRLVRVRSALAAACQFLLATLVLCMTLGLSEWIPEPVRAVADAVEPFRLANHYGLFAVMTRDRPIVIFEGSDDGVTWREYDYRWQSGDPARAPAVCMPHMPRVDWMAWFAGLNDQPEPWTIATEIGLLEARPQVLELFGRDPFEGRAPRYVRSVRYRYAFAPWGDEDWWVRFDRHEYGPTLQAR